MTTLKKFIENEANYKCSIGELEDALGNICKVIPYSMLEGYNTIDDLFENKEAVIILIESKEGNHFITLLNKKSYVEYFDSYGDGIDYMINKSGLEPYLTRLLQTVKVVSNKKQLQKMDKKMNNCGRWAYIRIILREMNLKEFQNLFSSSMNLSPDEIVCLMTSLIF